MPAQAFLPHRTVEAFDIGLLVLTIRPGNTMTVTEGCNVSLEISLEFRPAVGLDKVDVVIEASRHASLEKRETISSGQFWCQEDICFPGIDVDGGEGKETTEVDSIHLHHFPRAGSPGYRSSCVILLPAGANDILLGQYLVNLGYGEMDTVFQFEKILNLLPAALHLPLPYLPDPSLYYRVDPPALPFSFLGLLIPVQEGNKTVLLNTLNP